MRMLRFIDGENTSRYSTGRPGRENAPAVADPPAKPISPGSAVAAKAATANRRNHLPRNFSFNFITATNPPFSRLPHFPQLCAVALRELAKHAQGVGPRAQHSLAISRLANDSDSARTRGARLSAVTIGNEVTSVTKREARTRRGRTGAVVSRGRVSAHREFAHPGGPSCEGPARTGSRWPDRHQTRRPP